MIIGTANAENVVDLTKCTPCFGTTCYLLSGVLPWKLLQSHRCCLLVLPGCGGFVLYTLIFLNFHPSKSHMVLNQGNLGARDCCKLCGHWDSTKKKYETWTVCPLCQAYTSWHFSHLCVCVCMHTHGCTACPAESELWHCDMQPRGHVSPNHLCIVRSVFFFPVFR